MNFFASFFYSNDNYCFCPPPPGKPNFKNPQAKDRSRVILQPQKENFCSYYALRILSNEKIASNSSESDSFQKFKKESSDYRRTLVQIRERFLFNCHFAEGIALKLDSQIVTRVMIEEFRESRINEINQVYRRQGQTAIEIFCAQDQCDDFVQFVNDVYYQAVVDAQEKFLLNAGFSQEDVKQCTKTLDLKSSHLALDTIIFRLHYRNFGARKSAWHPNQPIEKLIRQLKLYGPHYVQGYFGQAYYKTPPAELPLKIEGRTIFGWDVEAQKLDTEERHAIIIIGAQRVREKTYVYFVDPLDSSDPTNVATQKIYAITYDELVNSIVSLNGILLRHATTKIPIFLKEKPQKNMYALHMGKKTIKI